MRGVPSLITDIRKKVFTEVARMAYSGQGYEAANPALALLGENMPEGHGSIGMQA